MENKYIYLDRIIDIMCDSGICVGIDKRSKDVIECGVQLKCSDCLFNDYDNNNCHKKLKEWLNSNGIVYYITKLEYEMLNYCYRDGYKFIIKDSSNNIFVTKGSLRTNGYHNWIAERIVPIKFIDGSLFSFVNNEEPLSIKRVLDCCSVIKEDEE